jgi:hypothetical protein
MVVLTCATIEKKLKTRTWPDSALGFEPLCDNSRMANLPLPDYGRLAVIRQRLEASADSHYQFPTGNSNGVRADISPLVDIFVQKNEEVCDGRRLPKLSQERSHLTAVIGRVIYDVLHHISQRVFPSLALKVFVRNAGIQKLVAQTFQESLLLVFHCGPARVKCLPIVKVLWNKYLFRRLAPPSPDPQPLTPHDVNKSSLDGIMTAV